MTLFQRPRRWGEGKKVIVTIGHVVFMGTGFFFLQLQRNHFYYKAVPRLITHLSWEDGKNVGWAQCRTMGLCFAHHQLKRVIDLGPQQLYQDTYCGIYIKTIFPKGCSQQAKSPAGIIRLAIPKRTGTPLKAGLPDVLLNIPLTMPPLTSLSSILSGLDVYPTLIAAPASLLLSYIVSYRHFPYNS